ncbi:MAG: hypothetical protein JWN27_484 [Candidatus Eremiobacteraeota bacterium]|nr:hypothetical protein [Candidatus Eremiobacteraeota bacterium]
MLRLAAGFCVLALLAAPSPCSAIADGSTSFAALAAAFIADSQRLEPVAADYAGVTTYSDALPDRSESGHEREIAAMRAWRARFAAAPAVSDANTAADRRTVLDTIDQTLIENETVAGWRHDPASYVGDLGAAFFLVATRPGESADRRFSHIARRLTQVPRFVDAAIANLVDASKPSDALASSQLGGTIAFVAALERGDRTASPVVRARISAALPTALAALHRFRAFLDGPLRAKATRDPRIGRAAYDRLFRVTIGTDATPEELAARARERIAATRAAMLTVAEPVFAAQFPGRIVTATGDARIQAIVGAVLDERAKHHTTRDGFIAAARAAVAETEGFLRATHAIALPRPETLRVRRTPAYEAGVTGASAETAGPYAPPNAPSYYNVDPPSGDAAAIDSQLREDNDDVMRILTIHEAVPGHYVQLRYANRNPSIVRRILGNGSFIEGWAVWTEGFMLDQGFRDGDAGLRLAQLKWRLREATNALLDIEYHAGALSHDEAIRMLVHDAFQEKAEAEGKWHRLQLSYVQLSSYFAGLDAIERAENASPLDQRAFAKRLLDMGSVEPRSIPALLAAGG